MHLPVQLLGKWDQSADTAETLARDLAYGYKVKDCEPEQEAAFKAWLAGETDNMPEEMPISQYVAYSFVVETNQKLCYLSQFSSFPERLCAYAFKTGQITTIQWMMRQMLLCLGTDYTHTFLNNRPPDIKSPTNRLCGYAPAFTQDRRQSWKKSSISVIYVHGLKTTERNISHPLGD